MRLSPGARDQFRVLLDAARNDLAWSDECRARDERRRIIVPQLLAFLRQLREGQLELPAFRETFDVKTRTEWDGFGLKAMSGAMFLNKLVMHLPDQASLRRELLAALELPGNAEIARERMSRFLQFLHDQIATGEVSKMQIQPGRTPFFVSAWWHLQDRESWPIYYESARSALSEIGLFAESSDSVTDYFAFRDCWLELAREFQLASWDLEAALSHAHRQGEMRVPPVKPPPIRPEPPGRNIPPVDENEAAPKHAEVQAMLAEIGQKLGLRVWIASNDHGRFWNGQRLGEWSISELPNLGIGEDAQRIVNLIDVLWLRGNNQLVSAFEIECSTSIYSGVLRMSDLSTTCPNLSFPCYIALPAEREPEVIRQLSRPTFQALDLHRRCGYFVVEDLKAELAAILRWSRDADCIRQLAKYVSDVA